MNESQTRLEKIDPALHKAGWGLVEDSRILTEVAITRGRVSKTVKPKPLKADYILYYKGAKLAVVEAKSDERDVSDGVAQAKIYAKKLQIRYTYATNGNHIYEIDMETGDEHEISAFPSPQKLWVRTFGDADEWRDKFYSQPLYNDGNKIPRYYQEIAINRVLTAIAEGKSRILLTLATGTGKTYIAFQIAWKLFQSKWNVKKTGNRPRILFLADRNTLANQAFTGFYGFPNDALVRITTDSIRKGGRVPTNGSVFFTIFQTFMSGDDGKENFGDYPRDFFDFIIIDECHRGGAKDESNWRGIMEYFNNAVQLGLTATPRRTINADTYNYFGEPVYQYALKEGIEDGFLTPFRYCKMQSNIDDYIYRPEDEVLSGDVDATKIYNEKDFYQGNIEIKQRDEARVKEFMSHIADDEKTIVFCASQNHAGHIRDMINALHKGNPEYAVRVVANDGEQGENYLKEFKDNEKTIPTILTTSQKLSTGVDALNVRNIVLLRPVNSIIEFKQIVGRGTRLFDGKYYFTIYDFVKAYERFNDPGWDGEPVCEKCGNYPCTCKPGKPRKPGDDNGGEETEDIVCPVCGQNPCVCPGAKKPEKLVIRLSDGHTREIRHLKTDMFWGSEGKPISAEQFLKDMFGQMPRFFKSEQELREKWSTPQTREELLDALNDAGYGIDALKHIRRLIDAEDCDLLDVIEYVAYNTRPMEREERTERIDPFYETLNKAQQSFVDFLVDIYVEQGVEELASNKLPDLMKMKYGSIPDATNALGGIPSAKSTFLGFQRSLYL